MTLTLERLTADNRPYQPFGAAKELMLFKGSELLLAGPAGTGKAQPLDAVVWTPTGPKLMGALALGDAVLSFVGGESHVIGIYPQGVQSVYRLTFTGGDSVECTGDHLWQLHYMGGGHRNGKSVREIVCVRTVAEILGDYVQGKNQRPKYWVPQPLPAAFEARPVPIPPYTLGVLLGDGYLRKAHASFTTADAEIVRAVTADLGDRYVVKHLDRYSWGISSNGSWSPRRTRQAKRGYVSFSKAAKRFMARVRVPGGAGGST